MTALMPARTGRDDLAHRLAVTLTGPDAVTVAMGLAAGATVRDRRDALLVLASAEEDLHDDGLTTALHEAVEALTPGLPDTERAQAWQHVCEAAWLIPEWLDPISAWLLAAAGLPPGGDPKPTVDAAVDGLEYRRDMALTKLLGGAR